MSTGRAAPANVLVVDLDGTLTKTDMLVESVIWNIINNPRIALAAFVNFLKKRNKAQLKQELAKNYKFSAKSLPMNSDVLSLIEEYKSRGSVIALATGSDKRIALNFSAEMPGRFDFVFASDGKINLTSTDKAAVLAEKFVEFDYVGNSRADFPVWAAAKNSFTVGKSVKNHQIKSITGKKSLTERTRAVLRQIRVHQWSKNALIALSIVLSHRFLEADSWLRVAFGIISFGLISSAVYIFNDLVDIQNDREHSTKRFRPMASGDLSISEGVSAGLLSLALGCSIAFQLRSPSFGLILFAYLVTNVLYSFWLKKTLVFDVVVLALLYSVRLWAGAALIDEKLTFWIVSFSTFLFLSLAFLKRYSEIVGNGMNDERIPGRGYLNVDKNIVLVAGISSTFVSMSFLALYLDSAAVKEMYQSPVYLWAWLPILLTWSMSLWFKSNRGEMPYDPIVFALRDRTSLISFVMLISTLYLAMFA